MKTTIYCPDIECDSCVKILNKTFNGMQGINNLSIKKDHLEVEYEEAMIKPQTMMQMIKEKGYRAALEPFARKTFKERSRDFFANKHKYELEHRMITFTAITFVLLMIIEYFVYYFLFRSDPTFLAKYGIWFLYATISTVFLAAAVWHINAYKANVTHMVGMMIGMTFGMQTGLLIGPIIGATNGMFMGSIVGMLLGIFVGWMNGKCCGVMGVMEGTMAGIMGGTMGAMTSVMMLSDNLLLFMPIFIIANIIVLLGLSYMLYEEVVESNQNVQRVPADFATFFSYCFVVLFLLGLIIIYGYKSALVGL
ncbi:hypothetical protein HZA96_05625 [Candidatus Woesearchaeota archaeon]|nr:hypothetical protein [Candidatus Woesearchaeota archaeon]